MKWRWVPVEPTETMLDAASWHSNYQDMWRAMLEAAPRKRNSKMSDEKLRCARSPCATCPYRRDVPSGIWAKSEYEKLPAYDGPTWQQHPHVFMCHQRDGRLCAGWVGCHGAKELLALRFPDKVHPSTWDYKSPVPLWSSGLEAAAHGAKDIHEPGLEARRQVTKLAKRRRKR